MFKDCKSSSFINLSFSMPFNILFIFDLHNMFLKYDMESTKAKKIHISNLSGENDSKNDLPSFVWHITDYIIIIQ